MLKSLITAAIVWPLCTIAAHAQNASDVRLTPDQISADIALVQNAYERVHPGYTRYANPSELDAAWAAINQKAESNNGMSAGEFYLALQKALTLIRCDHTKAELPKSLRTERNTKPVYLPIRWELIEQRALITTANASAGLSFGDEIVSIDGRPLAEMVAEVETYIPYQGNAIWARQSGVGTSLEFMGGAVDHFGALLWDIAPQATLTIKTPDGVTKIVTVDRILYDDWVELGNGKPNIQNFKDAVTYRAIGDNAGYLKIDTFVNYRDPINPNKIYGPIFKSIEEDGVDYLILDLRENGGGSNDARLRLTAHLIEGPLTTKTDLQVSTLNLDGLREHISTWERSALKPRASRFRANENGTYSLKPRFDDDLKPVKPAKHAFDGTLIILTSSSNSSGSTSFTAVMKSHRDAVLIGDRTGGTAQGTTAGVLFTLTLPESKIRTRLPVFRSFNNVDDFDEGMGLTPDVFAPMTVDAFLADDDPALDAAIDYIRRQSK